MLCLPFMNEMNRPRMSSPPPNPRIRVKTFSGRQCGFCLAASQSRSSASAGTSRPEQNSSAPPAQPQHPPPGVQLQVGETLTPGPQRSRRALEREARARVAAMLDPASAWVSAGRRISANGCHASPATPFCRCWHPWNELPGRSSPPSPFVVRANEWCSGKQCQWVGIRSREWSVVQPAATARLEPSASLALFSVRTAAARLQPRALRVPVCS